MNISTSDTSTYASRSSSPTSESTSNSTPTSHYHNQKIKLSIQKEGKINGNLAEKRTKKLDQKRKNSSAINTKNMVESAVKDIIKCIARCTLLILLEPIKYLAIAIQKIINLCMIAITAGLIVAYGILLFAPSVLLNVLFESIVWVVDSIC